MGQMVQKILYVDDEEVNLVIFEANFKNSFEVITASSGAEGLELLNTKAQDVEVVISDMKMPLMNGLDFIKQAKSIKGDIKYYLLTAFYQSEEIEKALREKSISGVFTKPLDKDIISTEISKSSGGL